MPAHIVTVSHNFETAHRLPHIPGKCMSLHGHSWWADITVSAPELDGGIVVEFGPFKKALRRWIDEHLDHGVMLGSKDPLVGVLRSYDTKVHVVDGWPTVETVAAMLGRLAGELLAELGRAPGAQVTGVTVRETFVNSAGWSA
ncbi:6-pyruvoyl tetrahydropterin synthase family protein [Lentzea sp. JNUCC 0626]|uniref:6-pyruvoyl trahydropterin synthase family protein n=1 Tax=Lentzea sp. JNUCC 0626 TaxID=3367513 RepID=UPI0037479D7C